MIVVKGNGTAFADILASVSKAASAGLGDLIAAHGAFIAGNIDNLNNI